MMNRNHKRYDSYSDEELINNLMKKPADEGLHRYFFFHKCEKTLHYISSSVFNTDCYWEIIGEFYTFLSRNDWQVLRTYKNKNQASLLSYLSHCAINYFRHSVKKDNNWLCSSSSTDEYDIPDKSYGDDMNEIDEKRLEVLPRVFSQLKEADRIVLTQLVMQGNNILQAADAIWPYISPTTDWRKLPVKYVQDTISMRKRRAALLLAKKIQAEIDKENREGNI